MDIDQLLTHIQNLNNEDFIKLITALESQKEKRTQLIIDNANAQIISLTGKSTTKRKRNKIAPKYIDPVSGKTWSGQGREPQWFANHITNGGKKEDLLIS